MRSPLIILGAVAVVLLAAGCGPDKVPAAPAATTPSTDAVRLIDYSDNDGPTSTVILTGTIGDFGGAETVDAAGRVDPEHGGDLKLTLTHGSFRIDITALHRVLVAAFAHFPADTATCSGSVVVTADAPVAAGSGTGDYAGIHGTFTLTATIAEVDAKPVCDGTGAFLRQFVVIDGTGHVTV